MIWRQTTRCIGSFWRFRGAGPRTGQGTFGKPQNACQALAPQGTSCRQASAPSAGSPTGISGSVPCAATATGRMGWWRPVWGDVWALSGYGAFGLAAMAVVLQQFGAAGLGGRDAPVFDVAVAADVVGQVGQRQCGIHVALVEAGCKLFDQV